MGQIDMAEGKGPGNERAIPGIELLFNPEGPDPVQIVLNGLGVDQPAGVKEDARPQELDRFLDLGGLREASEPGQQIEGIDNPIAAGCPFNQELPG